MTIDLSACAVPVDFGDTERMDMKRRMLMLLTRKAGPLTIFFDVRNLRYTIVPSALRSFNFLLLTAAYAATAATTRVGIWVVPDAADAPVSDDVTALLGMELLVTFTLVFYFGYCYNRFWEQYALAMACKGAIVNSVMLARSSRLARTELLDLYVRSHKPITRRARCLSRGAPGVPLSPFTWSCLTDSTRACDVHRARTGSASRPDSAFSTWPRRQATWRSRPSTHGPTCSTASRDCTTCCRPTRRSSRASTSTA